MRSRRERRPPEIQTLELDVTADIKRGNVKWAIKTDFISMGSARFVEWKSAISTD